MLKPYNDTPERDRSDHHSWEINGETYQLSAGATCTVTPTFPTAAPPTTAASSSTIAMPSKPADSIFSAPPITPKSASATPDYEWWQTQKLADLFHNPGSFVSIYAYEREQKFPYGHRNVLFEERGGPIVYIKRKNYSESRYATPLPKPDGEILGDIPPWQLWDLLRDARQARHHHRAHLGRRHGHRLEQIQETPGSTPSSRTFSKSSRDRATAAKAKASPQPPVVVGSPQTSQFKGNAATGTWQEALACSIASEPSPAPITARPTSPTAAST